MATFTTHVDLQQIITSKRCHHLDNTSRGFANSQLGSVHRLGSTKLHKCLKSLVEISHSTATLRDLLNTEGHAVEIRPYLLKPGIIVLGVYHAAHFLTRHNGTSSNCPAKVARSCARLIDLP
jgi:hypothetical protein